MPTKITPFSLLNPPSLRDFSSADSYGAGCDAWRDWRAAEEKAIASALPAVPHSRDCICPGELPGQLDLLELLDDDVAELPCRRCGCLMPVFPCPACGSRDPRNPAMPLLDEGTES